jgi:Skp family chaperone for outer membrane proteins
MTTIAKATIIITAAALSLLSASSCRKQQTASIPPPPKARIATVDMQKLFTAYYKTTEAQKEINEERASHQKENTNRLTPIRALETELFNMKTRLQGSSLSDSDKAAQFKEYEAKWKEVVQMDRDRRDYVQNTHQQLNEKYAQHFRGFVEEIRTQVEKYAKTNNYDYVSCDSILNWLDSQQLAYTGDAGNATDITVIMLNIINKDAPVDFQSPKESQPTGSPSGTSSYERNAALPHPKLRIAKVDMVKLVSMYYKNVDDKKLIDEERETNRKNDEKRQENIRTIEAKIADSQKQIDTPTTDVSLKIPHLDSIKRHQQEAQALRRTEDLNRRNDSANVARRQRIQPFVEEIRKIVIERCKADGFDYVTDRIPEASSTDGSLLISTVPTPDGLGAMTDVTDIMLQEINKNAPTAFKLPQ